MSRETKTRYRNPSSDSSEGFSMPLSARFSRPRAESQSAAEHQPMRDSPSGYDMNGKVTHVSGGHAADNRIVMQTRVAVRNNTPHRFQMATLREVNVSKLHANYPEKSAQHSAAATQKNSMLRSGSGMLGPSSYLQTRALPSSTSIRSFDRPLTEDYAETIGSPNVSPVKHWNVLDAAPSSKVHLDAPSGRRVLTELDLNRDTPKATAKNSGKARRAALDRGATVSNVPAGDFTKSSGRSATDSTRGTSQSLYFRPQPEQAHQKYTSLSSFGSPLDDHKRSFPSEDQVCLQRSRSTYGSGSRRRQGLSLANGTSFTTSDVQDVDLKSKRRHAIFHESLNLSYPMSPNTPGTSQLEQAGSSEGEEVSSLVSCCGSLEESSPGDQSVEQKHESLQLDYGSFSYNSFDSSADGQEVIPADPRGDDPFEIKANTRKNSLADEDALRRLALNPPQKPDRPLRPIRALRYTRQSRVTPLGKSERIVYPTIVLTLFADIDRAIEQWCRV